MQLELDMRRPPRVLSYGGGADSFAVLLRSIELGEPLDAVVFVDVSNGSPTTDPTDPGEWPGTYRHVRERVIPICAEHGIRFEWLDSKRYPVRDAESLYRWLWDREQIPVAGPDRVCTAVAKTERFERWMHDNFPGLDVEVWIGFEAGEEDRATKDPNAGLREKQPRARKPPKGKKAIERARLRAEREAARLASRARRRNAFPLIEWGWCRCRAVAYIRSRGEPVPRKSACMGCCYNLLPDWQRLQREQPAVFAAYVELERRKPPTAEAGVKLSLTGFKMLDKPPSKPNAAVFVDKLGRHYRAPPLDVYVLGKGRPTRKPCSVCGAAERATKEVGCGWQDGAA